MRLLLRAPQQNLAAAKSRIEGALECSSGLDALNDDKIIVLPLETGCRKVRSASAQQSPVDLVALQVHWRGWKIPTSESAQALTLTRGQHFAMQHTVHGHAKVSIDLKGFPRGTKTAASAHGVFRK
jgi:hypothetical protein